jgi:Fic family protein
MRTYETTHPWLTFGIDLRRAPWNLWAMLGECQSKCEHIASVPLRPQTDKLLHRLFLARGALATTAIEGNTLSEKEVLDHLEGKLQVPPSREYLVQEIDNVIHGCDLVLSDVLTNPGLALTVAKLAEMNRILLDRLTMEEGVAAGQVRKGNVGVGKYRGAPPEDCTYLLERLCQWLESPELAGTAENRVVFATLRAVMAHLYLAWIHPFGDGNGRTARLVELRILIAAGVPTPAAHLLSNHYNQTRTEYYRQLDAASRTGDPLPFILYAVQGFRDGLRSQLDMIRAEQMDVAWRNFVHEAFASKRSPTDVRRRHLVLDLSARGGPVPIGELPQLSPRLAASYATKTRKTLQRDVNALRAMELVDVTADGVRARQELIVAFLPVQASAREQVEQALERLSALRAELSAGG